MSHISSETGPAGTIQAGCSFRIGDSEKTYEILSSLLRVKIGSFSLGPSDGGSILLTCNIDIDLKANIIYALEARFDLRDGETTHLPFKTPFWEHRLQASVIWDINRSQNYGRLVFVTVYLHWKHDERLYITLPRIEAATAPDPLRKALSTVLWEDPQFCDVTLKLKAGRIIEAHKTILRYCSPVFAAMFTHGFKETNENIVQIPDITYETMHEALRFIYTGENDEWDVERTKEMVEVAERYDLSDLKKVCAKTLISHVEKNIFLAKEVLPFAEKYSMKLVFEKCELAILKSADVILDVDLLKLASACGATNLREAVVTRLTMQLPQGLDEIREFDSALADQMVMYKLSYRP